jgi:hypothetical protein
MKKFLQYIFVVLSTTYYLQSTISPAHASWVPPQPPFSVEGNPSEDAYYGDIFALFRYIRPPALEIYENQERTRNYEDLEVCTGEGGPNNPYDGRDYLCDNVGDTCDGGDVGLCKRGTTDVVRSGHSGSNNNCTVKNINEKHPPGTQGTCRYNQRPATHKEVKGTDFSNADQTVFDKIQSKSGMYNNVGTDDNPITYGSQQLSLDMGEKVINQLMVLKRAKQTKNTVKETGEWPLGWVDWGYQTPNGKTLLEIHDALPDGVSASGMAIVEGADDFFLNAGNLEAVSDTSQQKEYVIRAVAAAASQSPPPVWVTDLLQTPLYSPSWRQSYVRPSICVWNICCPGLRCIVPPPVGIKRALYYDNSISQAFGAALDKMLATYSLDDGVAIFNKLAIKNPLIRFTTSAAPGAIPSKIVERLDKEIQDPCHKYVKNFTWLWFGTFMDYVKPGDYFDADKKCPVYAIAPELSKENAAAFYQSPISALIAMLWGRVSPPQDDVDSVVYHTLTIPEAMGQSIQEIQQPVYDTRDTLAELDLVRDFNLNLSNTVDDNADHLYAGETPFESRRMLPYYSCSDPMFSSQLDTSILDYASGKRVGCFDTTTVPEGKCDGKLFGELLKTGKYQESSIKGSDYFNNSIKTMLTPELMNTYAAVEKETGVPCEILAGIHFVEADNNPDGSLVSGRKIGDPEPDAGGKVFRSLLETAIYAGDHLKGKVGGNLKDVNTVITALSRYNGGGNSNCQVGYPYPIPYGGCPRLFEGEDDPYPVSFLDPKHDKMYLLYCADYTACAPKYLSVLVLFCRLKCI